MVSERGQLLLIGAVVIGVTIVGTVVLMNDMQYAGAAGSKVDTGELDRAEQMEASVERDATGLVTTVLESDPRNPTNALTENITVYGNYSRNMTVTGNAATVNVTYNDSQTDGERLSESSSRQLDNPSGSGQWSLVEDADYVRRADLTVDSISNPGNENAFVVTASNASSPGDPWKLRIVRQNANPSSDYEIQTRAPGSASYTIHCPNTDTPVELDLLGGSGDCSFTGIRDTVGVVDEIQFEAGSTTDGGYTIDAVAVTTRAHEIDPNYPAHPAITYRYRTEDISYNRTIELKDPEVAR